MRIPVLALALLLLTLTGCNLTRTGGDPAPIAPDVPLIFATPTFIFDPGSVQPTLLLPLTPDFNVTPITGPIEGINPNCPPPPGWVAYTVQNGDSMGALSAATGATIAELVTANCLGDPDAIFAGQVLFLPTTPQPQG